MNIKKMLSPWRHGLNLVWGFFKHSGTKKTSIREYAGLRTMFVATNGRSNELLTKLISWKYPPREIPDERESFLSDIDVAEVAGKIAEDGFYIFPTKLPDDDLLSLQELGKNAPCRAMVNTDPTKLEFTVSDRAAPYDPSVVTPKFVFDSETLLENETVRKLFMDPVLHRIAQSYLGTQPIVDMVSMWWSQPCGEKAHTSAAQLYHFDMDRIKFLKFFFYLTDVTPESGPHCYVRGSCKRKPKSLLKDGRLTDAEVLDNYSKDDIMEICGEAGTILAVDTRGWHKGKVLTERNRLLLEFEITNSLFGASFTEIEISASKHGKFSEFVAKNRRYCSTMKLTETAT